MAVGIDAASSAMRRQYKFHSQCSRRTSRKVMMIKTQVRLIKLGVVKCAAVFMCNVMCVARWVCVCVCFFLLTFACLFIIRSRCDVIDFFGSHVERVRSVVGEQKCKRCLIGGTACAVFLNMISNTLESGLNAIPYHNVLPYILHSHCKSYSNNANNYVCNKIKNE